MTIRKENGYLIISDIYEPAPLPRPVPSNSVAYVFAILAVLAIVTGALIAVSVP
jgi:hypothetical protein